MEINLVLLPLHTICLAYIKLCCSIDIALQTQVVDAIHLNVSKQDCLQFFTTIEQHVDVIPIKEQVTIESSIHDMLNAIDDISHASADPPEAHAILIA
ncbi:hypothetical protein PILCRDRAFT_14645 [Piloderma croceum F 1598]|uniref:Uncharacterized protein n=1 Tax=Piloderma croceum (strain F 1598) TaxID=765440 RepID=A0A0C3AK25_PILCF|nr:hypothetical protein PILCRDRAFT_14645 [Piloderma croceum F 1598]